MFLYQPDAFPGLFAITRIGSDTQKIEALFGGKGDIRFGGVLDAHEHAEFSLAEERRGEIKVLGVRQRRALAVAFICAHAAGIAVFDETDAVADQAVDHHDREVRGKTVAEDIAAVAQRAVEQLHGKTPYRIRGESRGSSAPTGFQRNRRPSAGSAFLRHMRLSSPMAPVNMRI